MSGRLRWSSLALLVFAVSCKEAPPSAAEAPAKKAPAKKAPAKKAPAKKAAPKPRAAAPKANQRPAPPVREASREEIEATIATLSGYVRDGATDPLNPWALAHGMLAFGGDMKASDGRRAVDVIVTEFATPETVAGRKILGFPLTVPSETIADPNNPLQKLDLPVEPHPDLLVKSVLEAGVPLDNVFTLAGGRKVTLQQLVDDAAWAFKMPTTEKEWHKFAWSTSLFLRAYGIGGVVKSHEGEFSVRKLVARAIQRLEHDQAFLLGPHQRGRPEEVQKRKQGIYGHTCGGLHFIQTAALGAGRTRAERDLVRVRKQLALVDFRWDAERRIYRQLIQSQPKYRFLLLVQEMKFHGHVLETMAMAHDWGVLHATPETKAQARRVAADLIDAVKELEPMYMKQANLEKSVHQTYLDLIGDGCHAIRGLRQSLVAFFGPPTNP